MKDFIVHAFSSWPGWRVVCMVTGFSEEKKAAFRGSPFFVSVRPLATYWCAATRAL